MSSPSKDPQAPPSNEPPPPNGPPPPNEPPPSNEPPPPNEPPPSTSPHSPPNDKKKTSFSFNPPLHSILHQPSTNPSSRQSPSTLSFPQQFSANHEEEEDENFPDSSEFAEKLRSILTGGDYEDVDPEYLLNKQALFIQMDILCAFPAGQYGWKEISRWLKFEEKVDASGRWSKPHVSTVSLRAMLQLKYLMENEKMTLMFDLDTTDKNWSEVRDMIVETVVKDLMLTQRSSSKLSSILQAPHKHKGREGDKKKTEKMKKASKEAKESLRRKSFMRKEGKDLWNTCSSYPKYLTPDCLEPYKANKKLLKELPKNAEVANVWVGTMDFCAKPISFLCRFKEPFLLDEASETNLPTRFLFVSLSNQSSLWQMYEMGRAMAVMLNDKVFCEVALRSENRGDLVVGMSEMIDDVLVLPPSIWDPTTRLDPPSVTMTMERICKRLQGGMRIAAQVEQISADTCHVDESLQRSNVLFGGLVKDVKRRYPLMLSDIRDGLNVQCLGSIIFLYFACITPIVTFGGLMSDMTGGSMGTIEMLLAASFCGMTYAIFSGQPLTIVGATGPLLVFETTLFELCTQYKLHFMPLRFWIGAWTFVIMILIVAFDLSSFIKYITRFTEESFSVLISLIFIYEAITKLHDVWLVDRLHTNVIHEPPNFFCHCYLNFTDSFSHPLVTSMKKDCFAENNEVQVMKNCINITDCELVQGTLKGPGCTANVVDSVSDVFLLSAILLFGTYGVATFFKRLRSSTYFPQVVRAVLADFAIFLSLVIWTLVDYLLGLDTHKLDVPTHFQTTAKDRGWLINPLLLEPWWMGLLCVIPSCLTTILLFLDQHITAVIVNRKENKLEKGHGYHLDLLVLSFQILLCSFFGLPWFCAATVRSISHVQSLVKISDLNAPGETPKMLGIREQRVTSFVVHVLIGLSIFGAAFLKFIPMPVLYGVFFFMGVTSLQGVQFIDRIMLLLMPTKDQPDYVYLRHVETKRVHFFTLIQVLCSLVMWLCKTFKPTSLVFPITVLALVLIRKCMDVVLTQKDLFWLDNILPENSRRNKEDQIMAIDFARQPNQRRRSTRIAENYYSPSSKSFPLSE